MKAKGKKKHKNKLYHEITLQNCT